MVYTLSDLKHLETMAQLEEKELETPDVSILPAEQKAEQKDASFTPLLLSLCSKLRSQGFEKHASSLESKFLLFKQADAQTHLYKAHKETGEDLVESAHPDGDNKIISDMSNDLGDVETIVSRHKKIVDILQKQPTGKLAHYVEQCKIALGVSVEEQIEHVANAARHNVTQAFRIVEGAGGMLDTALGPLASARRSYLNFMEVMNKKPLTVSDIDGPVFGAIVSLDGFEQEAKPSLLGMGASEEAWSKAEPLIAAARENLATLKNLLVRYYSGGAEAYTGETPELPSEAPTKTVLSATIDKVAGELGQAKSLLASAQQFASKAADATKKDFLGKVQSSIKSYVGDLESVLKKLTSMQSSGETLDLNRFSEVVSGVSRFSASETYGAFKDAIGAYHSKLAQAFEFMKGW